jgi:hypothetical protein
MGAAVRVSPLAPAPTRQSTADPHVLHTSNIRDPSNPAVPTAGFVFCVARLPGVRRRISLKWSVGPACPPAGTEAGPTIKLRSCQLEKTIETAAAAWV